MTLRRHASGGHPADELDSLIRWALRERVAGATPSPYVWKRIRARVEHWAVLRRTGKDSGAILVFLRAVAVWLSADMLQPVFVAQPAHRDRVMTWGYDLGWVRGLGQHRVVMWPVS